MDAQCPSLWSRQGCILAPGDIDSTRLVQTPTAWQLPDGLVRVAVSCRDMSNVTTMWVMDCDPEEGMRIVRRPEPDATVARAIEDGGLAGLGPCDAIWDEGTLMLATSSIVLEGRIYNAAIGLMTSPDAGATFSQPRSILTSASNDGFPVTLPCLRRQADGSWRMWFTAFTEWFPDVLPKPDARYCIRSARSMDGVAWTVDPHPAIDRISGEAGLARPTVMQQADRLEMWFSARGPYSLEEPTQRRYCLRYATSPDGEIWRRHDDGHGFVNPPIPGDWDDKMQCYPCVIRLADGREVMLYAGNGYGEAGIGWAVRIQDRG